MPQYTPQEEAAHKGFDDATSWLLSDEESAKKFYDPPASVDCQQCADRIAATAHGVVLFYDLHCVRCCYDNAWNDGACK